MDIKLIFFIVLALPYLIFIPWIISLYVTADDMQPSQHFNRDSMTQFRQASPEMEYLYKVMPNIEEAWGDTKQDSQFVYLIFSRYSDKIVLKVKQSFKFTQNGMSPTSEPKYYVEDILDEYGTTLKTSSRTITKEEFYKTYISRIKGKKEEKTGLAQ